MTSHSALQCTCQDCRAVAYRAKHWAPAKPDPEPTPGDIFIGKLFGYTFQVVVCYLICHFGFGVL